MHVLRYRAFVVVVACAMASSANAQIHQLKELSTRADRGARPIAHRGVMPGGILEEHGPYLPSFTDGYFNESVAQRLAEAIVARPGWNVVMFPTIPLESVGPTRSAASMSFRAHTPSDRPRCVRCSWIWRPTGEQGFRSIFIVHTHGGPITIGCWIRRATTSATHTAATWCT